VAYDGVVWSIDLAASDRYRSVAAFRDLYIQRWEPSPPPRNVRAGLERLERLIELISELPRCQYEQDMYEPRWGPACALAHAYRAGLLLPGQRAEPETFGLEPAQDSLLFCGRTNINEVLRRDAQMYVSPAGWCQIAREMLKRNRSIYLGEDA
jgi:hypothetical protein